MSDDRAVQVLLVEDGDEALDFLVARGRRAGRDAGAGPGIVLLDLRRSLVDGLEVLRQIKADQRNRHVPVVVLTSSRQDPDVQRCNELGADSYIVKPVDFQEFAESVTEVGFCWLLLDDPPRSGR